MKKILITVAILLGFGQILFAQSKFSFERYHKPHELSAWISNLSNTHAEFSRIHKIGSSYSGIPVNLIEIGSEVKSHEKSHPAVFVAANFEGTRPLASEGALYLAGKILENPELYKNITWYILPVGNPEGAGHFFNSLKQDDGQNTRPFNDDMDDAIDEDPNEDLNGDGFITQMRVKDPSGNLLPDTADARKLRRPDLTKGERGLYKVYSEGIDNDNDGKYNEDGIGGTNNGVSFPHLFKYHGTNSGLWSGQEDEVYGVLKFMTDHQEVAMVMYYGSTNFCLMPPRGGRKGGNTSKSIKVPRRYATMIGADPNKSYTMSAVIEMMKAVMPPGVTVDESTVAGMLGLGAAVNPLPDDLKFYKSFSDKYKKYLKKKGFDEKRLDPLPAKDGSFELWCYYHLGLPVFSMDFWGLKEKSLKAEKAVGTEGKSDGERKKAEESAGLKAQPSGGMTQGNKGSTGGSKKVDKEKVFLQYSDSVLGGKGFVNWTAFDHPQLGLVEIGGVVPYADQTPLENQIDSLLSVQVPWVFELLKEIPKLSVETTKIKDLGENIFQLEVWIRNDGGLPFPTSMGKRNRTPVPAVLIIEGEDLEFLSGRYRSLLTGLDAGKNIKFKWLIKAPESKELKLTVKAMNAHGDVSTIKLGGK
ncbi:MAG: hypothetical protein HN686_11560 [Bacteroidetes bacterium]|nr:hypothetical protein [Bacteroidota bacterium]MBT7464613.1 hypothetical protein [Bacteroidota bacterium]